MFLLSGEVMPMPVGMVDVGQGGTKTEMLAMVKERKIMISMDSTVTLLRLLAMMVKLEDESMSVQVAAEEAGDEMI